MRNIAISFLAIVIGAATLGVLDAGEWPRLLFLAAMMPFVALAVHFFEPELQKWVDRRRAAHR